MLALCGAFTTNATHNGSVAGRQMTNDVGENHIYTSLTTHVAVEDSIRIFEAGNRRILLKENEPKQRVDVQVYEKNGYSDSTFYEKIFEGHYRDGNSVERRKYMASINIPMPGRKFKESGRCRRFDPHWSGLGLGFASFTGDGDSDNIPFNNSRSFELNFNLMEKAIPISHHYRWAIVTGLGIRWTRYHLKGNRHFEEFDDYTRLVEVEDVRYKRSKLGITSLSFPLLLEWQNPKGNLFFSAGVVGSVRTWSSSKIEYYNEQGQKRSKKVDKGMTLRPINIDILSQVGQVGTRRWGAFVRYTPISLFERNKGPELYPLSFGLFWHLF
jgi:hypothetical protein